MVSDERTDGSEKLSSPTAPHTRCLFISRSDDPTKSSGRGWPVSSVTAAGRVLAVCGLYKCGRSAMRPCLHLLCSNARHEIAFRLENSPLWMELREKCVTALWHYYQSLSHEMGDIIHKNEQRGDDPIGFHSQRSRGKCIKNIELYINRYIQMIRTGFFFFLGGIQRHFGKGWLTVLKKFTEDCHDNWHTVHKYL